MKRTRTALSHREYSCLLKFKGVWFMLKHCRRFKEYDIWFLSNTPLFCDRKLFLGKCPSCREDVALLIETRIKDRAVFKNYVTGFEEVKKICGRVKHQVAVTMREIAVSKGKPYGWTYGDNREIKNNKGNVFEIRQYRCDFYGQKEIVKRITV